jgi:hypothetical protein
MRSPGGMRRRREVFAGLVDGRATPDDASIAALGNIADALRTMGRSVTRPGPDPEFRSALRQRLVAVATVQASGPAVAGALPARPPSRVAGRRTGSEASRTPRIRRGVMALAGVVALATSVTGVALAAGRSLPGNPLYDLKQATESVQLWTAHGQAAKGHRHLEFAATRLSEARALPPTSSHLPSTLNAMDAQTRDGASDLIAAAGASHSTTPLLELRAFTHTQYAGLKALMATSTPALRAREVSSANLLASIDQQAALLVAGSGSGSGSSGLLPGLPGSTLPGPGTTPGSAPESTPGSGAGHGSPAPTSGGTVPTPIPTKLPSTLPTTLPSIVPSRLPTKLPSSLPSLLPSILPTAIPKVTLPPLPVISTILPTVVL